MNRINATFQSLKSAKKKAFIPFLTAGFPSIKTTKELVLALEQAGADIIEIGVPFSDPMADGPTIQASSQYTLDHGMTMDKIFNLVKHIRSQSQIPLALMTYYNPVNTIGEEAFVKKAKAVGVDGLIIPDLPAFEAKTLRAIAKKYDMALTFFLAPTTQKNRIKSIADATTGFIYYVSIAGVTGGKQATAKDIAQKIKQAKSVTKKPICIGFGVSTAEQAKSLAKVADGIIVGSAIIKIIQKHIKSKNLIQEVIRFAKPLIKAIK